MNKSWLFLIALYISLSTSCAQVEVSFDADNVARPRYIYDPSEVPATPLCPLINLQSYKQETAVWCWAASAQTVINYLGRSSNISSTPWVDVLQWEIANNTLDIKANPPTIPYDCRVAEDSYIPADPTEEAYRKMRDRCLVRRTPLNALKKNNHSGVPTSPITWPELNNQLCGNNPKPYIFVVQFYDDNGNFAGRHSAVVEGARVTSSGDKYVEVSDHSNDDFFLMKWEAFKYGVPGDFRHEIDYINIQRQ